MSIHDYSDMSGSPVYLVILATRCHNILNVSINENYDLVCKVSFSYMEERKKSKGAVSMAKC